MFVISVVHTKTHAHGKRKSEPGYAPRRYHQLDSPEEQQEAPAPQPHAQLPDLPSVL